MIVASRRARLASIALLRYLLQAHAPEARFRIEPAGIALDDLAQADQLGAIEQRNHRHIGDEAAMHLFDLCLSLGIFSYQLLLLQLLLRFRIVPDLSRLLVLWSLQLLESQRL